MDDHALQVLEFEAVRHLLASLTGSPLGAERAMALAPVAAAEGAEALLDETTEARLLLAAAGAPPFGAVGDIRPALERSRVAGGHLEPAQLLAIAAALEAAEAFRAAFGRSGIAAPRLAATVARLTPPRGLAGEIRRCLTEDGAVRDEASPALARVRQRALSVREEVRTILLALVADPALQPVIAEPIVTLRNDRYVIPLRPGYRALLPGVVQDQSGSGQTLFVEPLAVVERNNELRTLARDEEEEVRRILAALTGRVRGDLPAIAGTLDALAHLDLACAKAALAERWQAARPRLRGDRRLRLLQARHPLLVEQQVATRQAQGRLGSARSGPKEPQEGRGEGEGEVVPIDVVLGDGYTVLVITGPNTGGKTVALKTVGLLALMAQAGLHIPASGDSELPIYRRVFADIGDEQSIAQSLSTFSGHMGQIVKVLEAADGGSLVLLDELGAGTDPAEGAALGIAILEALQARGASVLASTHLDAIKAFAASHPAIENASVGFDLDSLRPTYTLFIGLPGQSYAIDIAARLGLPPALTQRSRHLLGETPLQVEALLARLREGEARLADLRAAAERDAAAAALARARHQELVQEASKRLADLRRDARGRLEGIVAEARRRIESAVASIRAQAGEGEAIRAARREAEAIRDLADRGFPASEEFAAPGPGLAPEDLRPGLRVWIAHLGQMGSVLAPPVSGGSVEVQLPLGKARVPLETLSLPGPERAAEPALGGPPPPILRRAEAPEVSLEINLIGATVEEAQARAQRYLDDAFLAGLRRVRIIHGKGSGALRRGIAAMLEGHPLVASFRLADFDEGGTGASIVTLQSDSPPAQESGTEGDTGRG